MSVYQIGGVRYKLPVAKASHQREAPVATGYRVTYVLGERQVSRFFLTAAGNVKSAFKAKYGFDALHISKA